MVAAEETGVYIEGVWGSRCRSRNLTGKMEGVGERLLSTRRRFWKNCADFSVTGGLMCNFSFRHDLLYLLNGL